MKNKMKKELGWEVKVLPVQIKGKSDVLNKALVRSDDESLIGIRGKYYHPVFNRDLELLKKKILKSGHFNFKGYEEFQNGKRILAFFENRSKNLKICDQPVKDYLIIGNSNDGTSKLFIGTSNFMLRCQNQFSEKIRSFERRHDRPFNIKEVQIDEIISSYEMGRNKLYSKMDKLRSVPANMELIEHLVFEVLFSRRPDDLRESLNDKERQQIALMIQCIKSEIKDLGVNLWGVFNGVTRYTSNHFTGNPGFGVVNGRGEHLNRRAMNHLIRLSQPKY